MQTRTMALGALAMLGITSPERETLPVQTAASTAVEGQYTASCGHFAVRNDDYIDVNYKLFYDKSGSAIRELAVLNNDGFSKYLLEPACVYFMYQVRRIAEAIESTD